VSAQARLRCREGSATRATQAAAAFLDLFFGGELERARARTHQRFAWFGQTDLDWSGTALRTFVGSERTIVEQVRLLQRPWLLLLKPGEVETLFGPVSDDDHIVVAHLRRGEQLLTVALVLAGDTEMVLRVTDAVPFKTAMLRVRDGGA
jgi:hypothetical protein